jgi:hypothetical protein
MNKDFMTDFQVAALLEISVRGLRNKVASGQPLPPFIRPPGCRVRLWPVVEFNNWMRLHMAERSDLGDRSANSTDKCKSGDEK